MKLFLFEKDKADRYGFWHALPIVSLFLATIQVHFVAFLEGVFRFVSSSSFCASASRSCALSTRSFEWQGQWQDTHTHCYDVSV